MMQFERSIEPLIEARMAQFTRNERNIAAQFLAGIVFDDPSSKAVAQQLNTSEASLTRFAQKCGFRGFREFVYAYSRPNKQTREDFVQPVLASYQELLNKTYSIVDMAQIRRLTEHLLNKKRVYVYGKGSSGMVAREMKLRFMRIGLVCEAITDDDMMRMNVVTVDKDCLVIGISISGRTQIVVDALQAAAEEGATTVLFTANEGRQFAKMFDEVLLFAVKNNLEYGRMISPQFPVLVVLDILYADYMNRNKTARETIWQRTYDALQQSKG
ncbi:MurR/RpiR family transcriptional regulator [Suttonella sp. R2A3]|uniref:MurR/RpiR family transcriptional regulator n=1 Tax=Suttonella sp. R2A3 TaxID=2908648 RepID=UPI001F26C76C|nr:MurR/RpiR family transcriptional regulator [Suttonella sp. R2A3]UJF24497.1 MurR/RpiR family transcriptional regulator [Suttonella sp. R2A3]